MNGVVDKYSYVIPFYYLVTSIIVINIHIYIYIYIYILKLKNINL